MSSNIEIIETVTRSSKDDNEFKKIKFDPEKIKNQNNDFKNIIVNKPWGFEYLTYSSEEISIWVLNINKSQKTSLHCHPNKKTSLILLKGEANLYTLDKTFNLKSGNAVVIDKGAFHRTSSEFGQDIVVMEIETPTNKNDIVRYEDMYKRSNSGYETKESFSESKNNDLFLNFQNIKIKPVSVGDYLIQVINNENKNINFLNKKTLIFSIKLKNKKNTFGLSVGELFEKKINQDMETLLSIIEEFLVIQKK